MVRLPWSDACHLAQGKDALICWWTLCERSELIHLPQASVVPSHEAGRGVNGFGAFCRNKRALPAGAKPGNIEHHAETGVGETIARPSFTGTFSWKPQDGANRLGWDSDASFHRMKSCHSRQARSILRQQAGLFHYTWSPSPVPPAGRKKRDRPDNGCNGPPVQSESQARHRHGSGDRSVA